MAGPSNFSFLSFRVIFHFHDYGRKGYLDPSPSKKGSWNSDKTSFWLIIHVKFELASIRRIIPISMCLVTPICKQFRPFGRGPTTRSLGDLPTILQVPITQLWNLSTCGVFMCFLLFSGRASAIISGITSATGMFVLATPVLEEKQRITRPGSDNFRNDTMVALLKFYDSTKVKWFETTPQTFWKNGYWKRDHFKKERRALKSFFWRA